MRLKKLLVAQGIENSLAYNPLTTNWVAKRASSELQGLNTQPKRVGAKSVILTSNRPVRTKSIAPAFFAAVVALVAGVLSWPQVNKTETPVTPMAVCAKLEAPMQLVNGVFHDWIFQLTEIDRIGSISRYTFAATCGGNQAHGELVASGNYAELFVKAITPAK